MGFFKRLWGYIKTLFRIKAEAAMDPEVEIEQAIQEARKRDQELRNQAAKVVAHRTLLENNINSLKSQFESAVGQADDAKKAVQQNAMRLSELAAKRMELVGSLQQAKMQESVNKAVEAISATMGDDAVSMDKVEQKIEQRKADAMARAELSESTPQGAEMELREAVSISQADSKLAELKAELGIGEGTPPALSPPPGN